MPGERGAEVPVHGQGAGRHEGARARGQREAHPAGGAAHRGAQGDAHRQGAGGRESEGGQGGGRRPAQAGE
eukprot:8995936-Pyramimonas_sp.AAC.1